VEGASSVRIAAILGILAVCPSAFALNPPLDISQYAHTAWKVRNGFSRGAISSIAQTPDGYLWLGTAFGLLRFDGVQTVPWQPPAGEQLPSNYIRNLLVARDGTLWIGTERGLAGWKDGKLTQHPELEGAVVNSLLQDRAGTVWVGVFEPGNGRLCAIEGGGTVRCHTGSFGSGVGALYEDRKGTLWVASDMGVQRWAPGAPDHYPFPGTGPEVNALIESDSGTIMMATSDGLKQLVGATIRSYALPGFAGQFRPNRLFRSRDGSLWVGTQQGLFHVRQGRVDRFTAADGLSGDYVYTIFEDREGNLWVSTRDGLDCFREFAVSTISSKQGLSNSGAWSVQATPDGSIWIGGPGGLHRWENGAVSEVANGQLSGAVRSLGRDDRGRLWVSTANGVFYSEGGRFMPVPGVPGGNIFSITADSNANVWISHGDAGLFSVTPAGAVQQIRWDQLGHKSTAGPLLPDRAHAGLWLGFANGIVFLKDGRIGASYNSAKVTHLRLGSDGAVWATTEGGLSRVKDGRITTLTSTNGLPCDAVHWAIDDDNESLWLYTPCGLVRIARSELDGWVSDSNRVVQATVFDTSDGVRSVGAIGGYGPHVTKSADGRIWFLPGDGVSVIEPRNLRVNSLAPPVHIEKVTVDRKTFDTAASADEPLRLPALTRDLQIDYTALSLVAPEKNRFRVKLEGWDRDWQDVGTRRQAYYTNLAPRNYRFRVIASNNSGVWNETGASLGFSIAPAYYQTTWFAIVSILATLALIWALYRWRVRQVAYAYESRLQERVNERTRIARELHDTLLQSFHGLLFRFQAAANQLPDRPADAKQKLESAIERAAQAITEGRDAVQNLRASTVVTNDLADAIGTLGEELLADHGHRSTSPPPALEVIVEGTSHDLHPIIRDDAYRIAGEALRNAFRHARAHRIVVTIAYDDDRVQLRVRDDGHGIDPTLVQDVRPGHFGLPGMRERAELVGGKVAIWSERDAGTEVELTIPASIAYAKSDAPRRSSAAGAGR
jgi:signal transduction histidine kinase/ligand-binding sensor domain-containing protein